MFMLYVEQNEKDEGVRAESGYSYFSQAPAIQPTNESISKCSPTSFLLKTASSIQLVESYVPPFYTLI